MLKLIANGVKLGCFLKLKWLHTGDLGSMNENGIIYFKGRAKELIIRGGVNIYPVSERLNRRQKRVGF